MKDPNLAAIFIGIVLGLILGSIPIAIPGISTPVKLGLAGGPIVVGILIGCFGPRFHLITYTTRSANLMLRGIGLSLYLACLGLDAGAHFFETVMRPEGAIWIAVGFAITFYSGSHYGISGPPHKPPRLRKHLWHAVWKHGKPYGIELCQ